MLVLLIYLLLKFYNGKVCYVLCCAIFVVFLCIALITKVRIRSHRTSFDNNPGILCAIFAPMPPVRLTPFNILHHSNHPPRYHNSN